MADRAQTRSIEPSSATPDGADAQGTMHVSRLAWPMSSLLSTEFRRFYVERVSALTSEAVALPTRTAPQSEWDRFDAWDESHNAKLLTRLLAQYPVTLSERRIAGVRAGVVMPRDGVSPENRRRVLINLHGGGFVSSRGLTFGQAESVPVAAIGRFKVITLDYRQAPLHRYPAATEDVEAVYRAILQEHEPGQVGIFGCSAGGTLTAQAVARFQARGLPRPGAVGIFSAGIPQPLEPLSAGWGDSLIWSCGVPKGEFTAAERGYFEPCTWYMQGADRDDVEAYPGLSDAVMSAFPPTLFLSGSRDLAMSTSIVSHAQLLRLGVDGSLYIMECAPHGAHVLAAGTPEAHDAQAYVARWFGERLARA